MAYLSVGETNRRIADYLSRFSDAVASQDAAALTPLLAVTSAASSPVADALAAASSPDSALRLLAHYPQDLADILSPLLRSIHSLRLRRYADAYASFEKSAG